jgi:hypothetical protein
MTTDLALRRITHLEQALIEAAETIEAIVSEHIYDNDQNPEPENSNDRAYGQYVANLRALALKGDTP